MGSERNAHNPETGKGSFEVDGCVFRRFLGEENHPQQLTAPSLAEIAILEQVATDNGFSAKVAYAIWERCESTEVTRDVMEAMARASQQAMDTALAALRQ
jgi:hypothetical protein